MDLTCWQKNIPGSLPLSLINLPGTHDSSTQHVKLSPFSRCQNQSIRQQLENGVRLLDIRLVLKDSVFYAVHGIADCRKSRNHGSPLLRFNDIFESIQTFLAEHPSEAVITAIKMDRGSNTDDFFPAFYKQFIEPYISSWYLENRIPALEECRSKLVFIRRCVPGQSSYSFSNSNTGLNFTACYEQLPWTDGVPQPCPIESVGGEYVPWAALIQDSFMLNPKQKWEKAAKPALVNFTPAENIIAINYLSTAGMPFIPRINSKYVNSKFNAYELQKKKYYGWICVDFPTAGLINKIIESNI